MKHLRVVAVFALLAIVGVLFARTTLADNGLKADASKLEAGLMDAAVSEGTVDVTIQLAAKADLNAAYAIDDWSLRGEYVVNALRDVAAASQANVLATLDGRASNVQSFFSNNVVLATVDAAMLAELTQLPEVSLIRAQAIVYLPDLGVDGDVQTTEWGLDMIRAPEVWADFGTTGEGVVVMNNDTGADVDHPALQNQYRGWDGASFDHDYNFYDPSGQCGGSPCDNNDHGSHTMGTMVGDDGGTNQIGVAPGAKWIAGKGCESFFCSEASLLGVADWALAPCPWGVSPGDPSCDAGQRPNVINNSWGGGGGDPWYQASVDAWQASGIIPVFSAGNSGPGAGTIGTPGDYCNVIGVGATNISDGIAGFSSRGPGNFAACQDKPDVSAPGDGVRSSVDGGGYGVFSGTSMAAPHVAGCVALMQSVDPSIDYDTVYNILTTTGVDNGAPGFDYDFGYGRIDCYEAMSQLEPDFRIDVEPNDAVACAGDLVVTTVNVNALAGYSSTVTLDDGGFGGAFGSTAIVAPGSTDYSYDTTGDAAGGYHIIITGSASDAGPHDDTLHIDVYDAAPSAPTVDYPSNGSTDVELVPTVMWTPGTQNATYDVGISRNPTFTDLHDFALGISDTSWTPDTPLDPLSTYYVAVRAKNPCGGAAVSVVNSFTTRDIPDVLLIDDDDNSPDVRSFWTTALTNQGIDFDLWDTNNTDNEPDAATMLQYEAIVWMTGDEFGGAAGPDATSEGNLATFLDGSGLCLLMSSQDYLWDRGGSGSDIPTSFMTNYLGMSTGNSDVSQTSLTGALPLFPNFGTSFPYTNWTDEINPGATANVMYIGNQGNAAIYKLTAGYSTVYMGIGMEALSPVADAEAFLGFMVNACVGSAANGVDMFAQGVSK